MPISVRYNFIQRFVVSAQEAFDWCTDFNSQDNMLMGNKMAEPQITHLANGVLILKDSFNSVTGKIEKQKLVHLYPDQCRWTSTHLTGPNKHSQFLYKITSQSKNTSFLTFKALHLEYNQREDAKLLAERLCKEDAYAWKLLEGAMVEDKNRIPKAPDL